MCGRYGLNHPDPVLTEWYHASFMPELKPRYNIAPTMEILAIRDTDSGRMGSMMRWGLIPYWIKDVKKLPVLNNARAETVAEKPAFRQSFRQRRCLIPASGFFEWKTEGRRKQPYFISSRDGTPFSFAGIYETWVTDTGEAKESCAIITTECNALMQPIHDRMPVILSKDAWDTWLDPDLRTDEILLSLLKPCDENRIQAWPVTQAVGKVVNQGEELFRPLISEQEGDFFGTN
ncbi:Putative SOS response-associated peptidase YedK [Nitrosospira multiformis]|uniref:Abasic site processing protein n=1 Tax=Nitrosospira multiformis TaxID=1231 RepID=A0A1I0G250_9PROT|nr:SOS response-associated peptidase [Nitrosospira multiformis]SET64066.1 Putative SOS response-associated peptidase YedK [Nitrosospira multiformis]